MKILFSPQVSIGNKKINYEFNNEIITVRYGDLTNTYNLSQLQDDFYKEFVSENGEIINIAYIIETTFDFSPIINAFRDETGTLFVEVLDFIDKDATEGEKNPYWLEI